MAGSVFRQVHTRCTPPVGDCSSSGSDSRGCLLPMWNARSATHLLDAAQCDVNAVKYDEYRDFSGILGCQSR
jgi:hypothetical protein